MDPKTIDETINKIIYRGLMKYFPLGIPMGYEDKPNIMNQIKEMLRECLS